MLNAAIKADVAEQVAGDAESLVETLDASPDFRTYLLSPQAPVDEKKKFIDATLRGRASDLLVQMLGLLIDKKRINLIDEIAKAFIQMYERHIGVVEVTVLTAIDLSDELAERTRQTLEKQSEWKVKLRKVVDPSIIGGMILVVDDKIIDGSIRHEIEMMKRDLKQINVTT